MIEIRDGVLHRDGRPELLLAGDYPYYRDRPERWRTKLDAIRRAGLRTVTFYVPWRHHEIDGAFVFDGPGNRDLLGFLAAIRDAGLDALAKPGPYVHAELPLGGLPERLCPDRDPSIRAAPGARSHGRPLPSLDDPVFATEVDRWLTAAGIALKSWQHPDGPLIAVQVGNEGLYGDTPLPEPAYRRFVAQLGLTVPALCNLPLGAEPVRFPHYGYTNWAGDAAIDDRAWALPRGRGPCLEENWSLGWVDPAWLFPESPIFNSVLGLSRGATGLTVYTACATEGWGPHLEVPSITAPYGESAPIGVDGSDGPARTALRELTAFLTEHGTDLLTSPESFVFSFDRSPARGCAMGRRDGTAVFRS
jgi:hypothetical protein